MRWLVLIGLVLGFAAVFVSKALREPAQPGKQVGRVPAPIATESAPAATAAPPLTPGPAPARVQPAPGSRVQLQQALRPTSAGEIRLEGDAAVGTQLQGSAGSVQKSGR